MRTKLSTCRRKLRFASDMEARAAAVRIALPLLPYACDRCGRWHLTSRTKGKLVAQDRGVPPFGNTRRE